jgi:hypothetical protein
MTDDWFFHEQTEEYQRCWRLLSKDGNNPELDYNELIHTIVELYAKIEALERELEYQKEYAMEQNERYD